MVIAAVSPETEDARALMNELDAEIAALYPKSPIDGIDAAAFQRAGGYFVVATEAGQAVGCGGFKPVAEGCAEIKRMFVRASARRLGIARQILRVLEAEARRRGFHSLVLETGRDNAGAIALYESEGYARTPSFPGCVGIPISRCYLKQA
jgi:GNAT superfamily N-acetyltransferase